MSMNIAIDGPAGAGKSTIPFNEFTHKPNPARSVVIVGTWNATLSKGVYPQGS